MGDPLDNYSRGDARQGRIDALLARGGESFELGRSREGRPLHGYRFTAPGDSSKRTPGVFLLSLLHPMEWIGFEAHLALLERWLAVASPLPAGTPIWSIPIANPDGVAQVEEALRRGRPRWVRGNAARVDLNRNFPVDHRARSRYLDWWPLYRSGAAPLSEPECAAVARLIEISRSEGNEIACSLSLHSFGRWFFYPPSGQWSPGRSTSRHRDAVERALHEGNRLAPYSHAQLGRWSPTFRAYGTEIDYLAEVTGGLAYLVEISTGGLLRWGPSRALHPFFAFNPPDPRREVDRLAPVLDRLTAFAIAAPRQG